MQKFCFILVFSCILFSCNTQEASQKEMTPTATPRENVIITNANPSSTLDFVQKWEGKTALEAGMFSDSLLVNRLKDLLGNEFRYFQENWNVQTPIEKENNIYSATGCKQHDCASYYSVVYFDVANNNINVLIKRGTHFKVFTERGEINLPENMKKSQGTIRENA